MKKRIASTIVSIVLIAALCISASAYTNTLTPSYVKDVDRYNFANTVRSNCPQVSWLTRLYVVLYVYNSGTGAVICNTGNETTSPSSNTLVASKSLSLSSLPAGTYCDHAYGLVYYIPSLSGSDQELNSDTYYTVGSSLTASAATVSQSTFAERGRNIAQSFAMDTSGYTCIVNTDIEKYIDSLEQVALIMDNMALSYGDTIPVYFLSADGNTLLAVKQDSSSTNYLFTFQKDAEGKWALSKAADTTIASTLYLQSFLGETAALNAK